MADEKNRNRIGPAATVAVVALTGLVFYLARHLEWTLGWIYVGLMLATVLINSVCLLRWNPVLIRRRMRFGKGTKTWDIVWLVFFSPVLIALYVVAVMDEGGPNVPGAGWLLGMALFVPGAALLTWSMVVNPFFEKSVRIQTEHGHRVIDTGPYALVRHPGYAGLVGWLLSAPLLLGSDKAFIPALLAVAGLMIRTAIEDRTLRAELPGYLEYTARVRHRLLPGVW